MPHVLAVYNKYHDAGFEIIGVSADRKESDLTSYQDITKLPWIQFFDQGKKIVTAHGIRGYPTAVLVNAEGKVVTRSARGESLDIAVRTLLKSGSAKVPGDSKSAKPPSVE